MKHYAPCCCGSCKNKYKCHITNIDKYWKKTNCKNYEFNGEVYVYDDSDLAANLVTEDIEDIDEIDVFK